MNRFNALTLLLGLLCLSMASAQTPKQDDPHKPKAFLCSPKCDEGDVNCVKCPKPSTGCIQCSMGEAFVTCREPTFAEVCCIDHAPFAHCLSSEQERTSPDNPCNHGKSK